jgi:hypothetical protein
MEKKNLQNAYRAINYLVEDVKKFANDNGGFISTHDLGNDTMYAYVFTFDFEIVTEQRILAICVKDDVLYILPTPYTRDEYTKPITANDFNEDDWYIVGSCGDYVLNAQTIISIAESIEQYV